MRRCPGKPFIEGKRTLCCYKLYRQIWDLIYFMYRTFAHAVVPLKLDRPTKSLLAFKGSHFGLGWVMCSMSGVVQSSGLLLWLLFMFCVVLPNQTGMPMPMLRETWMNVVTVWSAKGGTTSKTYWTQKLRRKRFESELCMIETLIGTRTAQVPEVPESPKGSQYWSVFFFFFRCVCFVRSSSSLEVSLLVVWKDWSNSGRMIACCACSEMCLMLLSCANRPYLDSYKARPLFVRRILSFRRTASSWCPLWGLCPCFDCVGCEDLLHIIDSSRVSKTKHISNVQLIQFQSWPCVWGFIDSWLPCWVRPNLLCWLSRSVKYYWA